MTTRTKQPPAVASTPNGKKSFSLISDEKLIALYAAMLKCRIFEERALGALERAAFSSGYDSAAGQEAAIAGMAIDLLPGDIIGPSPFGPIANLVKGAPLNELLNQLKAGAKNGRPSQESGHGSLIATGAAMANKIQGDKKIAVSFCCGPSTPSWLEALHFAGTHRLPILFVSWSSQSARQIDLKAEHLGLPCITVDGSDVVAVYRVACEAITHARKCNGPTLIECTTYDLNGHSTAAPSKRVNLVKRSGMVSDPILNMEKYLAGKGLFRKGMNTEIVSGFSAELDAAMDAVRKASGRAKNHRVPR